MIERSRLEAERDEVRSKSCRHLDLNILLQDTSAGELAEQSAGKRGLLLNDEGGVGDEDDDERSSN